jgi:hypothetical protein
MATHKDSAKQASMLDQANERALARQREREFEAKWDDGVSMVLEANEVVDVRLTDEEVQEFQALEEDWGDLEI